MKTNYAGLVILILATVLFAGCRTSPIHNVSDAAVIAGTGGPTQKQVSSAIVKAGNSLGWSMKEDAPGHIIGTLYIRKHVAIVDIIFDTEKYSITYKDSTNLKYDGEKIHSNYNGWIQNLDNAIKQQLSTL